MIDSIEVATLVTQSAAVGDFRGAYQLLEECKQQLRPAEYAELAACIDEAIASQQAPEDRPLVGPEALADRRCL